MWLSVDPLAEKAPNWTPYRYGFNNPIRYTDPAGMFENDDWVELDGKVFWDQHIKNDSDAKFVYGENAKYRAPGHEYTSKSGESITLLDDREFIENGIKKIARDDTSFGSLIYNALAVRDGFSGFIQYEGRAGLVIEGSISVGLAIDTKGNIGLYETGSLGAGLFIGAATSWSAGIASVDSIDGLAGWGISFGGGATGSVGVGVAFAGEINMPLSFNKNSQFNGFGLGTSVSIPIQVGAVGAWGGAYVEPTYTSVQKFGNLYDAANTLLSKIK